MIRAAALALSMLVAGAAEASSVNSYCGELASGGHMDPAETVIIRDDDGGLSGTYQFRDQGKTFQGTLSRGKHLSNGQWRFIWTDDFGTGALDIRFNADSSAFTGKWGTDRERPRLMWNGKRGESCFDAPST